jgi:hypothetical protein
VTPIYICTKTNGPTIPFSFSSLQVTLLESQLSFSGRSLGVSKTSAKIAHEQVGHAFIVWVTYLRSNRGVGIGAESWEVYSWLLLLVSWSYDCRMVIADFQGKQNNFPTPSDGLVGIHHKLVNHWCALEERANKRKRKDTGPVLTLRAPRTAGHTTRRGDFFFFF